MSSNSLIWKHFIKTLNGELCKLYKKELKSKNTTTNLHNHLKSMHKIEVVRRPEKSKSKNNFQNSNLFGTQNSVKEIDDAQQDSNQSEQLTVSSDESECLKSKQPSLTDVMDKVVAFRDGTGKAGQITGALLVMIIKDNLPFRTVEKVGFLRVMKLLSPLYKVPTRATINKLIDGKYNSVSKAIKDKFLDVNGVSLTCDVWTETTNTQSFLGVTAHYIYNNLLESSIIGVTDLHESHTADCLSNELKTICKTWNIDTVVAVVSDNAANITCAIRNAFTLSKHLLCLAHTINLVVTKTILTTENLNILLTNVKEIVAYFKRSVTAADELKKLTGDDFNAPTRLIQSVETRWNSTFFMFDRFLLLRKEVTTILVSQTDSTPNVIAGNDIKILKEARELLQPFESITREISAEKNPTCSKVIPIICNLFETLKNIECSSKIAKSLKDQLVKHLEKRFHDIEFNDIFAIYMLLDPRFKKLYFTSATAASKAIQKVNKNILFQKNLEQSTINDNNNNNNNNNNNINNKNIDGIWRYHHSRAQESLKSQEENDIGYCFELKQYLKEPIFAVHKDPLQYWISRKEVFPFLYTIAFNYMTIPSTSVPSERLFSAASLIMTKRRNRIKPEKLQKILFLQCFDKKQW
ncbi:E3 SUMO-protein ligase ZBED1-like [Cotesia typhae]|uniref:E3 SUMO-protein ligase ZBED1-like n=1 Tax=Cotesia typhae TaxID=2053667 RepID=UPI003D6837E5